MQPVLMRCTRASLPCLLGSLVIAAVITLILVVADDRSTILGPLEADEITVNRASITVMLRDRAWEGLMGNLGFVAALAVVLLVTPWAIRQCLRRRHGACLNCGYDLRGNSTGLCPECGSTGATRAWSAAATGRGCSASHATTGDAGRSTPLQRRQANLWLGPAQPQRAAPQDRSRAASCRLRHPP